MPPTGGATSANRSGSARAWRGWSATVSASSSRSGRTRCFRPICTTRCAPRTLRAACSARSPAGRRHADPFPGIAARVHVAGYDMVGATRFDGPAEPNGLPLYPWNKERFWFERTSEASNLIDPRFDHPLLGFRQTGRGAVLAQSSRCRHPAVARRSRGRGGSGAAGRRDRRDGAGRGAAAPAEIRRDRSQRCRAAPAAAVRERTGPRDPLYRGRRRRGLGTDEPAASRRRSADPACRGAAGDGRRIRPRRRCSGRPGRAARQWTPPRSTALAARLGLDYGGRFRTVRRIELLGSRTRRRCNSTPR